MPQRPNGLEDCVIPRQNPNDFVSATMPWNVEATDFATDLVGFALVGFSFAMNPQFQVGPGRKFEMCEIVSQLGGAGDYLRSATAHKRNYAGSLLRPYPSLFRGIPKRDLDDVKENMHMSE